MLENIKKNLFTIHGLITSIIHALIIVGALASWVFFQVQVLGNTVSVGGSAPSAVSRNK